MLALTLSAFVSLTEVVAASVPSLVRTNVERRAETLGPYLAGPAPDRSRVGRWLRQQGGGISELELSRNPHVAVALSSAVGLMAIVDPEERVVAATGRALPAGAPLWRFMPGTADAVVRAALAGRSDERGLTAWLGDGSLAAAASAPGPDGRVLGALMVIFTELDQPSLLGGALLMTVAVGVLLGPLVATIGAVFGFFSGRSHRFEPAWPAVGPATRPRAPATDGPGLFTALTARELEVLRLLAAANSNAAIAERLHISEKTVKKHVSNVLGKLEVPDRTGAAVLAWERGLVSRG